MLREKVEVILNKRKKLHPNDPSLLFAGKGAIKGAKTAVKTVAKQGVKGALKTGAKAAKGAAKGAIKGAVKTVKDLGKVAKNGGKALLKNGKLAVKGISKGFGKGVKSFKGLAKKIAQKMKLRKVKISRSKRWFRIMGLFNPWVLLASGEIKHVDAKDLKGKGLKVGDDFGDGVLIGMKDTKAPKGMGIDGTGMTGSKYVDDLASNSKRAADEFEELNNLNTAGKGDRIRGGAKSERVSLRKDVKNDVFDNAFSGKLDANGNKIYIDGKTGKEIPNYGKHYPDVTPSGHPHPKAGQKVPDNLVGKPRADIGHVKNQTWEQRLAKHKQKGSTRDQIIEAENNSKLYVLEERSSNRGRTLD